MSLSLNAFLRPFVAVRPAEPEKTTVVFELHTPQEPGTENAVQGLVMGPCTFIPESNQFVISLKAPLAGSRSYFEERERSIRRGARRAPRGQS